MVSLDLRIHMGAKGLPFDIHTGGHQCSRHFMHIILELAAKVLLKIRLVVWTGEWSLDALQS